MNENGPFSLQKLSIHVHLQLGSNVCSTTVSRKTSKIHKTSKTYRSCGYYANLHTNCIVMLHQYFSSLAFMLIGKLTRWILLFIHAKTNMIRFTNCSKCLVSEGPPTYKPSLPTQVKLKRVTLHTCISNTCGLNCFEICSNKPKTKLDMCNFHFLYFTTRRGFSPKGH